MYSIDELISKWFNLIIVDINPSTRKPTRRRVLQSVNLDLVPEEIGQEENEKVDAGVKIVDKNLERSRVVEIGHYVWKAHFVVYTIVLYVFLREDLDVYSLKLI